MGAFKSKPAPVSQVTPHDRAVLQMKGSRDRLYKYQKKLAAVIEKEVACAKQLMREGKQQRALLVLRKKKMQEQMLEKADSQLNNIQSLIDSAEFAQLENTVMAAMKEGTASIKALQAEYSVEDVEKLMDETADAIAYQKEVTDLLAEKLSAEDDDDVEEELRAMEKEMLDSQMPKIPSHQLPTIDKVPNKEPQQQQQQAQEEEEEEPAAQLAAA
ncbi:Vacuolar protein sorting-associated protein 20-like protein 1 [Diplonema papillatum]|nr:Vacuolar protein sorting-associated protein 20-like protein 1 [Diplonema papillatum]